MFEEHSSELKLAFNLNVHTQMRQQESQDGFIE